jgi:dolichol-phosphate mannosyltransferase
MKSLSLSILQIRNRITADPVLVLIATGILIRGLFLGFLNLLPEEAYYWNYSRHLDIGYLDHPPMVAWLIYFSETILGKSELAVRLPAFLSWFLLAFFMYRFTENTVGKGAAKPVLLLLAILPIFMSVGFLMTPDAPFYACWAGALFFLERAIVGKRATYWYGAGICFGLGLLSKYTMGLIVPATVLYLLIDKQSRHWLRRPQPYLALLIGLLLFMPVILWNLQHDWLSFSFQLTRRWSGGMNFNLHILIGSILVLITPLGLYEAVKALLNCRRNRVAICETDPLKARQHLFFSIFTLVPLAIFIIHSVQGQPKLNWTGPAWLAILPLLAVNLSGNRVRASQTKQRSISIRWLVTASLLLIFYAGGFGYLVAGMPGLQKSDGMKLPTAWKAFGNRIEEIETELESKTNSEPIIIGLDQYWLASQISFYDNDDVVENDSLPEVAAQNLVGGNSLMWNLWVLPEEAEGRECLLVSFTADRLDQSWVTRRLSEMGPITKETLTNSGGEIGHFYWRAGRYRR